MSTHTDYRLADLEAETASLRRELDELRERVDTLVRSLAERVHAQSELLSRRAESHAESHAGAEGQKGA